MTYKNLSHKILTLLQEDGRQSVRELAERLGVSATTIGKRLEQLEQEGILRGVTADIDYDKFGYSYMAVTRFKVQGDEFSNVLDLLEQFPQLTDIYEVTGNYDIMAIGHYKDRTDMNRVVKRLQEHKGVLESNTSMVLNVLREHGHIPLDDE